MSSKPSRCTTSDDHSELVVLTLLLDDATPSLWSIEELARELGDELRATDAVASLNGAGLVHRCEQLVVAALPATHFSRLLGGI